MEGDVTDEKPRIKVVKHHNAFIVGFGWERWTCVETGPCITFRVSLGKWTLSTNVYK